MTPDTPPPCPWCGTRLAERTEPDGGEEGGMLYAYLCPACRWEDAGSYDYQRLTVATAPWTRDLWAELVLAREERDSARRDLARIVQLCGWDCDGNDPESPTGAIHLYGDGLQAVRELRQEHAEDRAALAGDLFRHHYLLIDAMDRAGLAATIATTDEGIALQAAATIDTLAARVRELEAPGECQSVHKLRAALADLVKHVGNEATISTSTAFAWKRAHDLLSPGWRAEQNHNDGED